MNMLRWDLGATKLDRRIAKAVVRNARPAMQRPAQLLTWAADEHTLYVIAAVSGLHRAAATSVSNGKRITWSLASWQPLFCPIF
jgi:hypothetical protein